MLLNKMYSPLWESSDANWSASVGERRKQELCGGCRVGSAYLFASNTEALCVWNEFTSVWFSLSLRLSIAAALSGEETAAETVVHRGESISDN